MSKMTDGLAHELWAMAQTLPGEGIEDAVARIAARLRGESKRGLAIGAIKYADNRGPHIEWDTKMPPVGTKLYAQPEFAAVGDSVRSLPARWRELKWFSRLSKYDVARQLSDELEAALAVDTPK